MKITFSSLILFAIVSLSAVAQDSAQERLPEGAKARLEVHSVDDLEYSPDGTRLAIGSSAGISLYDTVTDNAVTLKWKDKLAADNVSFSPDGQTLATACGGICLWDVETGERKDVLGKQHVLRRNSGSFRFVEFSPDGRTIAAGDMYNVYVWDALTGVQIHTWGEGEWRGFDQLDDIAISPDGRTLAYGYGYTWMQQWLLGKWDSTIFLRDMVTGERKELLRGNFAINSLAFSPDGQTLACARWWWKKVHFQQSSSVYLLDVATGVVKHRLGPPHPDYSKADIFRSVAYSPDNRTVAAGGDADIHIWDAETGALIRMLDKGRDITYSIAFSPDGRTLIEGKSDGTVILWEITPLAEPLPVMNPHVVEPSQVAPDVNGDGGVDIQDLALVAARFGQSARTGADVNGDSVVNISDAVLVAGMADNITDTLSGLPDGAAALRTIDIKRWIEEARLLGLPQPISMRAVQFLQNLLAALTPNDTALLPNYPNPFNPETWIPYRLARDVGVEISIYNTKGVLVREMRLGLQAAGFYTDKRNAAYWDGCNDSGKLLQSGLYFYEFRAGSYRAARRMAIVR